MRMDNATTDDTIDYMTTFYTTYNGNLYYYSCYEIQTEIFLFKIRNFRFFPYPLQNI